MGKLAAFLIISFIIMGVGGCSPHPVSSKSPAPPKITNANEQLDYRSVRVIQLISDKVVLAAGTYYEITPASAFSSMSGAALQPQDLNSGDLVFLTASKTTNGQYPEKGILLSLVKQEDENSELISQAIRHVLENQEVGDIIAPEIKSVNSQLVTLQFNDWANEHRYECIVNLKSLAFHVKEIPKSAKK